jgi:hypothetical protein
MGSPGWFPLLAARAAFPHEREHRLNHSYGSKDVDRKLSSYLLQRGLLDRRLQTVSGIVHENIDCADIVLNLRDHRRHFFIIGYIENLCERTPRNLVVKPLSGFLISYGSNDAMSASQSDLSLR